MSVIKKYVLIRLIAVLGALSVALLFTPSSVLAANTKSKHCVIMIAPLQLGQEDSTATEGPCFVDLADAIATATSNKVRLPKDATPAEVDKALRDQTATRSMDMVTQSTTSSTVIAIEYAEPYIGGASYVVSTSGTVGCSSTRTFGWTSMPAGWANVISSARVYGGCYHAYHYDGVNYTNAVLDCFGGCNSMGVMDNQTESVRWTQ